MLAGGIKLGDSIISGGTAYLGCKAGKSLSSRFIKVPFLGRTLPFLVAGATAYAYEYYASQKYISVMERLAIADDQGG